MIKEYKKGQASQLSAHFKSTEFDCKCSTTHYTRISEELIEKLEKLHTALKCSKIIVTSGYRCSARDKRVGGSGSGKHTQGLACDVICYKPNGETYPSSVVCCCAQDIGFNGIANINRNNTAVHLDVASRKWYGDEVHTTTKSITADFYKYYNLKKSDVYPTEQKNYEAIGKAFETALKDIKNLDSVKKLLDLI